MVEAEVLITDQAVYAPLLDHIEIVDFQVVYKHMLQLEVDLQNCDVRDLGQVHQNQRQPSEVEHLNIEPLKDSFEEFLLQRVDPAPLLEKGLFDDHL